MQLTLDGPQAATLRETTFVVVDLETTGASPYTCGITEIGAVKVRGGEVLGELATLVDPGLPVPPQITVLTGITTAMLIDAPPVAEALPAFLEFAAGCVLVAHNAPFDTGFLKQACRDQGIAWPGFEVLDTVRVARRVLTRDEAPNVKLATLARLFRTSVQPTHRALDDARATVDVLHGLIGRLGNHGVHTLAELQEWSSRVPEIVRSKRHLADHLPNLPGVYLFRGPRDEVLYVGVSGDLRTRVKTYFTASETRRRMTEMVGLAERIDAVPCATALEAQVRELRLIAAHSPRYNRRSKRPDKASWVKVTVETFPRLSVVGQIRDDGATYLGPFGSRNQAVLAVEALHEAVPLRRCSGRLPTRPRPGSACALAEMQRCGAPCEGREDVSAYAVHVRAATEVMVGDPGALLGPAQVRLARLVAEERFEEAATNRDRVRALLRAAWTAQRLQSLTRLEQLVAAAPSALGGWELHVVRYGRLVGATVAPRGADPMPYVDAAVATAEQVRPARRGPVPVATAEETLLVLRWLTQPGVRLVQVTDGTTGDGWTMPARSAGSTGAWVLPEKRPAYDSPTASQRSRAAAA